MILRENFHENKKGQYMNALISVISIILFTENPIPNNTKIVLKTIPDIPKKSS